LQVTENGTLKASMRRLVIFLHGYDPRGGERYYKLYRDEAAKQAARSGRKIEIGPRRSADPGLTTCEIHTEGPTGVAETLAEFHNWDALARAHWARGDFGGIFETLRYSWLFLWTSHFRRLLRINRRLGFVALWPLLTILVPLALALIGVMLLCFLLQALSGWPWWIGLIALPLALLAALKGIIAFDRFSQVFWIGRTLAFHADEARGRLPEYDRWKDHLAVHLVARANEAAYDEILLVGHSVGAALAVSVVGRALALDPDLTRRGSAIALLTLGQSMHVLGRLASAAVFRGELSACALAEGVEWVDVTARIDIACAHLVDPVSACGILRPPGARIRPRLVAGRFHRLFSGESYARMKKTALVHQLYLLATEIPGSYDFFEITAGALPLCEMFCNETVEHKRSRRPRMTGARASSRQG
jgi:hypothetical protein